MSTVGKKPIIGILGGIGSGKSTVAKEFAKLGCGVVDADKLAGDLLDENGVREEIVGLFGLGICSSSGNIDRRKLADVVFADAEKLGVLNNIIHPRVLEQTEAIIRRYTGQNDIRAIVLDMPLLAEVGWQKHCDKLIFVQCDERLRAERAKKAGLFDENQLRIRENFQISLDNKVALADNIIYNNSDFSELVRQVANIFTSILDRC
ncbi:MAG: dephospho-CoA kinase [Sedimentisphaerales bacterium]|nr:dephospho-CoA kinase [Sedimentisphaerales bacterium]